MIGLWCNGSTTGFGSVCPGSNPGSPTKESGNALSVSTLFLCGLQRLLAGGYNAFLTKTAFTYKDRHFTLSIAHAYVIGSVGR